MHRAVALCLEGTVAFDVAAPGQVFASASDEGGRPLYEFATCSLDGAEVATTNGFALAPGSGLEAFAEADSVVMPGYVGFLSPPPPPALEALAAARERGARLLSICTGAFALAHAGLLDGRRATTHWAWADELASSFPRVRVDAAALYVDEGSVMTSAGLSAGIDLALHVVREDFGAAAGARAARRMVAAPHRDGGQAQFVEEAPRGSCGSLEATRRWAGRRLREPLDVAALARHAAVSPRTFARRFHEETGTTPHRWLLSRRVLEARRLLEETDLPVEEVAAEAGFGSGASLREHFRRATATTPSAYRRSFRHPGAP